MKQFIVLVLATITLIGCEDTEINTPALQAEIDNVFFKSNGAQAIQSEDGSVTIQGFTDDEVLTLGISGPEVGFYSLNDPTSNYATFEDLLGNTFSTNPSGGGQVEITNWDTGNNTLSGTFKFNAVLAGVDTLFVHKGFFFEVPMLGTNDPPDPGNDGTFSADIDEIPFTAVSVNAVDTGNSIVITGSSTSTTILLRMPIEVEAGTYTLPASGFMGSHSMNGVTEEAIGGTFVIESHDTGTNVIIGTFIFETASHSITSGAFNVAYQ